MNLLNDYLKSTFGTKVYKLALSNATTCPNRDGKIGIGGCIFCSKDGSGNFAESVTDSINTQIEKAKQRVIKKAGENAKYIAYFQSFSATYAPIEHLKTVFYEAINHKDIVALSIATRPDCLGKEVLDLLNKLNKIKPVWVELGLQTSNETTAKYIRRGYENSVYENAVSSIKEIGVTVITHMIIGLPNEDKKDIIKTARYIADNGSNGIKFHLLHVLKNTDLESDYNSNKFSLPSLEEYAEILAECIKNITPQMIIHRLTGDGDKKELIAPLWSANKKKVLNYINKYFKEINLIQGEHYK